MFFNRTGPPTSPRRTDQVPCWHRRLHRHQATAQKTRQGFEAVTNLQVRAKDPASAFRTASSERHGSVGPTRVPVTQNLALNEGIRVGAASLIARPRFARRRRDARLRLLIFRLGTSGLDCNGHCKGHRRHEHRTGEDSHDPPPCHDSKMSRSQIRRRMMLSGSRLDLPHRARRH